MIFAPNNAEIMVDGGNDHSSGKSLFNSLYPCIDKVVPNYIRLLVILLC
jgi:hypothetical protein